MLTYYVLGTVLIARDMKIIENDTPALDFSAGDTHRQLFFKMW